MCVRCGPAAALWLAVAVSVGTSSVAQGTTSVAQGTTSVAHGTASVAHGTASVAQGFSPVRARYLRVGIRRYGKLPAWHPGGGEDAWFFVDEIVIDP